jgi:hypothetical protein
MQGQVIISLLLGDKLNSGQVEFGLDGGINFPSIRGLSGGDSEGLFNIGFYFDIKTKNPNWPGRPCARGSRGTVGSGAQT